MGISSPSFDKLVSTGLGAMEQHHSVPAEGCQPRAGPTSYVPTEEDPQAQEGVLSPKIMPTSAIYSARLMYKMHKAHRYGNVSVQQQILDIIYILQERNLKNILQQYHWVGGNDCLVLS